MPLRYLLLVLAACGGPDKPPTVPPPNAPSGPTPTVATPARMADPLDAVTPLDPQIKVGKLANGLTYYVKKHHKPENRAALWLAVNAGSVLEDDDQRGLAHFVEHMAFNGTKRFPKSAIVDYIEKVGMDFGADLNAYTSFDETVYQLTVPTDDQAVLGKGMDILRDWAADVTFEAVEVEKERGVVLEEWRLGRGAYARIEDKQWPVILQGSRYATRLPIGLPDILKTAKRDTLVRYYKDWYRPDNMAVIAIGDFEPAAIEKAIEARFGDLTNPATPRKRDAVPVPRDHDLAVTTATDAELPDTTVTVYNKLDHAREETKGDYRTYLVKELYHRMLNARFAELALDPAAAFLSAGSSTSDFTRTADLFARSAQAKKGRAAEVIPLLFKEIARVEKFGFLPTELERARRDVISSAETSAREWDKTDATAIADEVTRHFFTREQMPGRPVELAMTRELLPSITLGELNHLASTWGGKQGRVIAVSGPAGQPLPSEADVRRLADQGATAKVEPWIDDVADKPLLASKPTPGKVVKTARDEAAGATVWTLSNGIRVIVKPTTFQHDEVQFEGWQRGGTSLLSEQDYAHVRFGGLVTAMGAGDLSAIQLRKLLSGKLVSVSAGYSELEQTVSGNARPADLETALELLYLRVTSPRKDDRAFAAWKQGQLEWIANRKLSPETAFYDEMSAVRTGNHPRRLPATVEMLDKVDPARALAVFKDRFADMGGFTFVFVGNLELATLQPLVERYLASLPTTGRKETWRDPGIKHPTRKIEKTILAGTEPKAYVSLSMGAPDKWTLEASWDAHILSSVLGIRMFEVLREDLGGVYGVGIGTYVTREPTQRRELYASFGCDPANVDKLKKALFDEIAKISKQGIPEVYLEKVREKIRRGHETERKENWWWQSKLRDVYYFNDDFKAATDIEAVIKRATSANVRATAAKFFTPNNYVLGVMRPRP